MRKEARGETRAARVAPRERRRGTVVLVVASLVLLGLGAALVYLGGWFRIAAAVLGLWAAIGLALGVRDLVFPWGE